MFVSPEPIAFYVSSWLWLLVRFFFTVALTVFVVLPFTVLMLYLVWKGWIQKRPKRPPVRGSPPQWYLDFHFSQ